MPLAPPQAIEYAYKMSVPDMWNWGVYHEGTDRREDDRQAMEDARNHKGVEYAFYWLCRIDFGIRSGTIYSRHLQL